MLTEELVKLKIGDEVKTKDGIATVKDLYQQTDAKGTPYMVKTEFHVMNLGNGCSNKVVMHTYLSRTFFMLQEKGMMKDKVFSKDLFLNTY